MADTNRRVPLWLIALAGGLAVFTLIGVFLFGSYSGLGSSL
jgi:photosystem II PsbJ protein|tara:strand:+ start:97 stop:219 length:123 start_codon:yes stop_codon:yes gene_type:complete